MQSRNLYTPPRSKVADTGTYGKIRIFSPRYRLGRLRYIGYVAGVIILTVMSTGILVGVLPQILGASSRLVLSIAGVVLALLLTLLTIQRAHDLNASGWLALLLFIPPVNIAFWIIPGTDGENRFGPEPPPNSGSDVTRAIVLPLLIALVAAVVIPAYQGYKNLPAESRH
ncbi:MAG: DUF805 domain-containing protein [Burkholderiales bacterium]